MKLNITHISVYHNIMGISHIKGSRLLITYTHISHGYYQLILIEVLYLCRPGLIQFDWSNLASARVDSLGTTKSQYFVVIILI